MSHLAASPGGPELSEGHKQAEQMDIQLHASFCAEQTERYLRQQPAQNIYCFELLRRAFVLHNQSAWEYIYAQYQPLVAAWVQKHPAFPACNEEVSFFVNGAFARVQRWCTPERFVRFATLPQWLQGLKACVNSEIVDYQRQQVNLNQPLEWHEDTVSPTVAPHVTVVDAELRAEAWKLIRERLQSEAEIVLVEYDFVLGYKARQICSLRPDLFAASQDVYSVKDNLLRRLRRDPTLRRFFEHLTS